MNDEEFDDNDNDDDGDGDYNPPSSDYNRMIRKIVNQMGRYAVHSSAIGG
jgi:hypothetical protein